ncbi:signal peptidase II [Candidatus Gracilibacteria bacterium]|nr:signal peptidase II [Candidatus Gracilibacteria bacterium]
MKRPRRAHPVALSTGPWLLPTVLASTIIVADQVTKSRILAELGPEPLQREIKLIGDWFSLVYTRNTGVAFSLFQGYPQLFTVTSIVITAATIYAYAVHLPKRNSWVQVSMGLIVGGAIGNIIDRLLHGYVIDFVRVGWWPVFNIADSAITIGVVMLAIFLLFAESDAPQAAAPRDDRLLGELLSQEPPVHERPEI